MPVATCTALCLVKLLNNLKLCLFVTCNDHLGDALTRVDDKILL